MQKEKTLKVFVCEIFEVQNEKSKPEVKTKSSYINNFSIFSNILENLFSDVNKYALPPTFNLQLMINSRYHLA